VIDAEKRQNQRGRIDRPPGFFQISPELEFHKLRIIDKTGFELHEFH
jgi:hypothetical protein